MKYICGLMLVFFATFCTAGNKYESSLIPIEEGSVGSKLGVEVLDIVEHDDYLEVDLSLPNIQDEVEELKLIDVNGKEIKQRKRYEILKNEDGYSLGVIIYLDKNSTKRVIVSYEFPDM